jgi:hypothetical protein
VGDVINLNKFRKAKARAEKSATAEQNRRKHGRTKAEEASEAAARKKLEHDLAGKHIDKDD